MGTYLVRGGKRIEGEFAVRGSKNAALPILAACVLAADEVVLENLPQIRDVSQTLAILREFGCSVTLTGRTAVIDSREMQAIALCGEAVRKMRSSILFLGAMLGRSGAGRIAYPGGCAIGKRPIDLHLAAFRRMGVSIAEENEILDCRAERLQGCRIDLPFPSVGATENILLLAVCAEGATVLHNAAREPEIVALVRFLRAMGAEIYGEGTGSLLIEGVKRLHGAVFTIPADRIEGGTFLCAAAMTGGELCLKGLEREQLGAVSEALRMTGCRLFWEEGGLLWMRPPRRLLSDFSIITGPFPAFPTDMQPQITTVLALASGTSTVTEGVWDNRYRYVGELTRMGAQIRVEGRSAVIEGVDHLTAASVQAYDLRAGAAMVIAALAAEGTSEVSNVHYIERGYENIIGKLRNLGAQIDSVECDETVETRQIG